jgi:hypothetical protein
MDTACRAIVEIVIKIKQISDEVKSFKEYCKEISLQLEELEPFIQKARQKESSQETTTVLFQNFRAQVQEIKAYISQFMKPHSSYFLVRAWNAIGQAINSKEHIAKFDYFLKKSKDFLTVLQGICAHESMEIQISIAKLLHEVNAMKPFSVIKIFTLKF